nr:immunoglobulin heavy chain junction region [Macaca mulatta]
CAIAQAIGTVTPDYW